MPYRSLRVIPQFGSTKTIAAESVMTSICVKIDQGLGGNFSEVRFGRKGGEQGGRA